jgi:CheY-like chemotaxis protein
VQSRATPATDELKKGSFVPDVLVSDVGLSETDGFALIREVRAFDSDKMRSLPAIAGQKAGSNRSGDGRVAHLHHFARLWMCSPDRYWRSRNPNIHLEVIR